MTAESDTDTRLVLVGDLRRLARHIRQWDRVVAQCPDEPEFAEYRKGLRVAASLAFLGTTHTDELDERWIAGLLDDEAVS